MILNENYTLNNGLLMPKLGLGTWMLDNAGFNSFFFKKR